jgi:RNA recognition motif-containing protein
MEKTLYVGNLPYSATEADVRRLFTPHGDVRSVDLLHDRDSGAFLGFAFVTLNAEGAVHAAAELDGLEVDGRRLHVVTTRALDLWARRTVRPPG